MQARHKRRKLPPETAAETKDRMDKIQGHRWGNDDDLVGELRTEDMAEFDEHPETKAQHGKPKRNKMNVATIKRKAAQRVIAMKKAEEEKKALPEKQMQDIIAKAEKETGRKFETTASGLKSIVLTEGTGDTSPAATDRVEVHYTGWLLDGTKFDSSVDRGKPSTYGLTQVSAGWTEGVALMKVGEKRKFIIPADLAYGSRGRPSIPPDSTLVFDVELLAIK